MAYPTPTIYTYRVTQVLASKQPQGYWLTEFSTNSGSTWNPLHPQVFDSDNDAFEAIGFIVSAEASFRDIVNGGKTASTLVPTKTILVYPPS